MKKIKLLGKYQPLYDHTTAHAKIKNLKLTHSLTQQLEKKVLFLSQKFSKTSPEKIICTTQ